MIIHIKDLTPEEIKEFGIPTEEIVPSEGEAPKMYETALRAEPNEVYLSTSHEPTD